MGNQEQLTDDNQEQLTDDDQEQLTDDDSDQELACTQAPWRDAPWGEVAAAGGVAGGARLS